MNAIASFTHSNTKQEVLIFLPLIAGAYYSPTHKATLVFASGGLSFPVEQSAKEVMKKVEHYHIYQGAKKNV